MPRTDVPGARKGQGRRWNDRADAPKEPHLADVSFPMIKLVTFLKRHPSLTRAQFEQRWLTVHAPMAAIFPGLRGYVLGFSVDPGEPAADGVAQLWFDSREAAQASYASDTGRRGSADANAYLSRRQHLLATEIGASAMLAPGGTVPGGAAHILFIGVKRAPERERRDFVAWWAETAPAIGKACGSPHIRVSVDEAGKLLNSGTDGALSLMDGEAAFDGLLEVGFPTEDALLRAGEVFRAALRPRLASRAAAVEEALLTEHVIVGPRREAGTACKDQP